MRVDLSYKIVLGGKVKVALVKQNTKKQLSKLALPRNVDSICWRLVLGASLLKLFQNSRGELILLERD